MQLVIAEKPSVAKSIADVLGALDRQDGYFEGGGYLVSWCVGHLIELAEPESYGEQWNFLMGAIAYRKGWLDEARRYYQTACQMEPGNPEYRHRGQSRRQ